ncbi:MAG: tyrosine-type recombinase/integrase [Deltaproteobacteria bacterium]|nr:tyrosine-type recombinase/integrase [Deltaproteobacteria bacterium]
MRQSPPAVALPYLERHEAKGSERAIIRFHHWLGQERLTLQTLTVNDPARFFAAPRGPKATHGGYYFRRVLAAYFYWLYEIGLISFHPRDAGLFLARPHANVTQLPTSAKSFVKRQGCQNAAPYLLRFHSWLDAKHVSITAATAAEVQRFFEQPFRKVLLPRNAYHYRRALSSYLFWLYDTGRLEFDPREIGFVRRARRVVLPESAVAFIQTLKPTLKDSSCIGYKSALSQFHRWLDAAKLQLRRLDRQQSEQWLMFLNDQKLAPATRIHLIFKVRAYLRWLAERGEVNEDPDSLIRSSDLPKLPRYLPRPLPPALDRELQQRLRESTDPLWRGLCLMRLTGMRVGELLSLEEDCLRVDPFGNRFLKVPLGKLDKERLVPLTETAYELLCWLKQLGPSPRARLLQTDDGRRFRWFKAQQALVDAAAGLADSKPITTHRLRHTYATELIGAGMSLVGVMKLLGHHSFQMTLRYTAVTMEHTGREYFAAMQKIEQRYISPLPATPGAEAFDPIKATTDIIAWLQNNVSTRSNKHARSVRVLSKRLIRLQTQIHALVDEKTAGKVAG